MNINLNEFFFNLSEFQGIFHSQIFRLKNQSSINNEYKVLYFPNSCIFQIHKIKINLKLFSNRKNNNLLLYIGFKHFSNIILIFRSSLLHSNFE